MSSRPYKPLPPIASPTPSIAFDDDIKYAFNDETLSNLDRALPVLKRLIRRQLLVPQGVSLLEGTCPMDIMYVNRCCENWAVPATAERYCRKLVDFQFIEMYGNMLMRADLNQLWEELSVVEGTGEDVMKAKEREKELQNSRTSLELVRYLSASMMNVTSLGNAAVCERCLQLEVHTLLFDYLRHEQLLNPNPDNAVINNASVMLFILINVVHRVPAARDAYRSCDAINVLQRLRDGENVLLKTSALVLQAYLVNEAENEKLVSNEDTFRVLLNRLSCSMEGKPFCAQIFSTPSEAIAVVNKLAVNDSNKEKIIEAGALPLYVRLMEDKFGADVQKEAAHGLWTLGFRCRDIIINEPGCMDGLRRLLQHSDERVRFEAEGALWTIENKQSQPVNKLENVDSAGHVFISYQRKMNKATVLRIRDRVQEAGFKVWFDDSDLVGNCMEEMAKGIHEASVMLVCFSQNYQESANCREEASYAFRLHKAIIPIRVQPHFNPDAPWLGLVFGNELVIDFSAEHLIKDAMDRLIRTLEKKLQRQDTVKRNGLLLTNSMQVIDATPRLLMSQDQTLEPVLSWTQADVAAWVERRNIQHLEQWFEYFNINGPLLMEFRRMSERAPETFYAHLLKDGLELADVLAMSAALQDFS